MCTGMLNLYTHSYTPREQVRSLWYHGFDNYMKHGKSALEALVNVR